MGFFFSVRHFYYVLYHLNVVDKTQMLTVSANKINHLLQNGKHIGNFFHLQQLSYDWTVGTVDVYFWQMVLLCVTIIPKSKIITDSSVCFHLLFLLAGESRSIK